MEIQQSKKNHQLHILCCEKLLMAFFWKGRQAKLIYWVICCKCEPIIKINCIHIVIVSVWDAVVGKALQTLICHCVETQTYHKEQALTVGSLCLEAKKSTCTAISCWLLVGLYNARCSERALGIVFFQEIKCCFQFHSLQWAS